MEPLHLETLVAAVMFAGVRIGGLMLFAPFLSSGSMPGQVKAGLTVALTMLFFGLGSAVPLIALGLTSREAMMRVRRRLLSAGASGKTVLGGMLIVSGLLILFDLDHALEAWFVRVAPSFLLDLSGRY